MRNGVCPKCGKADVRRGGDAWSQRSWLALNWLGRKPVRLDTYVCGACGYVEDYVRAEDLPRLNQRWPRVDREVDLDLSPR